ncbi:DUF4332 domain-containing protein [Parasynechococcus sp.]|uniref:DUF4332 domain-containing protein n=1 Tax=Parasynechococcus sp. TaxID=3101203 RepID=UPI0037039697
MDDQPLVDLPQSFRDEHKQLRNNGINSWGELKRLDDQDISRMVRQGRSSVRNFKRLRGIATLVCDLNLAPQDAALLMHAGIASVSALATSTPERLVRQTGRLERALGSGRRAVVDLKVAQTWIQHARRTMN